MVLFPIPKLADLIADPGKASNLPAEAIPGLLGELERLKATLWAKLTVPSSNGSGESRDGDRLLTAKEAGEKLGRSEDVVYRRADEFPFTVRDGRQVRFSEKGIEKYIRQRMGK